eukprot:14586219-Ditylum_brightwellii.AAC.2
MKKANGFLLLAKKTSLELQITWTEKSKHCTNMLYPAAYALMQCPSPVVPTPEHKERWVAKLQSFLAVLTSRMTL